jgi:type IV secretory pathway VirB3-like protein
MFMGVPLVPFVLLGLVTIVPTGWLIAFRMYSWVLGLVVIFFVAYLWMRIISKRDPWRTKQELMRIRMRRMPGNKAIWGGISYGPLALKRRTKQ